jgi:hypothetical protein
MGNFFTYDKLSWIPGKCETRALAVYLNRPVLHERPAIQAIAVRKGIIP